MSKSIFIQLYCLSILYIVDIGMIHMAGRGGLKNLRYGMCDPSLVLVGGLVGLYLAGSYFLYFANHCIIVLDCKVKQLLVQN